MQAGYNASTTPIQTAYTVARLKPYPLNAGALLTPLARTYRVRLDYELGNAPHVYVRDPDLIVLAGGRRLPHVYKQQPPQLCLYLPNTGEWLAHMRLVDTIVPWSILWLFYFEDWLETDEWKGGGMHPDSVDKGDAAHPVN